MIKLDPLRILFFVLFIFGMYLLIMRMLGHSATLEAIVTILTGCMFTAILDLYNSNRNLYELNGDVREKLARMEKDIEQIKKAVIK